MTRVALAPHPVLGPHMAGPGWRYAGLARALGESFPVTLLAPPGSRLEDPGPVRVVEVAPARLARELESYDVLVTQGIFASPLRDGPALSRIRLVYDFYDPLPVELPEHYRARASGPADPEARYRFNLRRHAFLAAVADAFLVADLRQRDLLLGTALAVGRLGVRDFHADPGLAGTFLEVPCGTEPCAESEAPPDSRDLAWGGGTWGWFDLSSALQALGALRARDARYRLVFPGLAPPGPDARLQAADPRAEAARLGLPDSALEVNEGWSPRPAFLARLARCRVGLSLAGGGIESRFAHRTRVLDYLSAGLPCVMTRGDALAEAGEREGFAMVVEPGSPAAVAAAVHTLAQDGPERSRALEGVARAAKARRWKRAVEPLVRWLAGPPRTGAKPGWAWAALAHQLRRLPGLG